MNRISWVLFDIGNVVISVEQSRIFAELSRLVGREQHVVREQVLSRVEFWETFIVTEYAPQDLMKEVNEVLNATLSEDQIVKAFNAELGPAIDSTVEIIPVLRKRIRVGCLSNTNSIHWDHMLHAYPVMQSFDRRFASQLVGSAKPSAEIYQKVVEHLGVSPREVLFFDDKQENVIAAQRLGWHGCLYTDHSSLLADLGKFSLLG